MSQLIGKTDDAIPAATCDELGRGEVRQLWTTENGSLFKAAGSVEVFNFSQRTTIPAGSMIAAQFAPDGKYVVIAHSL